MNKLLLSAASAVLAAASFGASAQELLTFNDSWGTPKSRAEVRAELAQAIASGQRLAQGEAGNYPLPATEGRMLSRAEVRAGLVGFVAPHPEAGDALPGAAPGVRLARAGTLAAR
ncbi:MAG: DUF4148 domain-containing protein [Rubrivivax sp.]|nr:DUF4148 domain-containing protein [Rubrivivax sp.]